MGIYEKGGNKKVRIKTYEKLDQLVSQKGGTLLTPLSEYKNSTMRVKVRCRCGYIWQPFPYNLFYADSWCPACSKHLKLSLQDLEETARKKGGRVKDVSNFVDSSSKIWFECEVGHIWEAKINSVRNGRWCPECAKGISERICRGYFEHIFGEKFPKLKPKWLLNKQGNLMELDGYCKKLELAFEYQGFQHFRPSKVFHRTRTFEQQKEDDVQKRELCREHEVILIEVPYTIAYRNMGKYIVDECKKKNIVAPFGKDDIDYTKLGVFSSKKLTELQKLCETNEGKCLSEVYLGAHIKLKFRCKYLHEWETTPNEIKQGRWCPECGIERRAKSHRYTIEHAQKLAKQKGGFCVSNNYIRSNSKLEWQCTNGHRWLSTYNNVASGCWCPFCAGNLKSDIGEMKRIAEEKGGVCLSSVYTNNHSKLQWKCTKEHVWWAEPASVKAGHWCLVCAGKAKHTIQEMQQLAKEKGGLCLSNKYITVSTKLEWQCKKDHSWESAPNQILGGNWCPYCARNIRGTVEEMRGIAQLRGGECLSKNYVNKTKKLEWQCGEGHRWKAIPDSVKRGTWCPNCAIRKKGEYLSQLFRERARKRLRNP